MTSLLHPDPEQGIDEARGASVRLEVDAVLEAADGRIMAIEEKSTTTPRVEDAAPMAILRDRLDRVGSDFTVGVVFHTGDRWLTLATDWSACRLLTC